VGVRVCVCAYERVCMCMRACEGDIMCNNHERVITQSADKSSGEYIYDVVLLDSSDSDLLYTTV